MIHQLTYVAGRRLLVTSGGTTLHHHVSVTSGFSASRCFLSTKVKKKEKKSSKGETSGRSRELELMIACVDAPKTKPPPADEEELARREQILKAYTIGKFKQHNEENHDLACKIRMKRHAINMLPKNSALKDKALNDDDEDNFPPRWRIIPAWTPPIPGFDPTKIVEE
jgi:Mitochondrial ribosomal protein L28